MTRRMKVSAATLARATLAFPPRHAAGHPMVPLNRLKNAPQRFFTDDYLGLDPVARGEVDVM
jgi:hypothetical protein